MKFLAMFSINRPEDHDFLVQMKHSDGSVMRVFVANPNLAKTYDDIEVVDRASDNCGQYAEPWILFNVGNEYLTMPIS